jgi:1-acyl-sn-glycerol-3-phosphate acyltransferase
LRTSSPIIPVGIVGARDVQPPDAKFPKPFMDVAIRFGRPIDVCRYADRANDRLVLRQITDELMYEIRALSGQEYVDAYATKTHESMPAESSIIHSSEPSGVELPEFVEPVGPVPPVTHGNDHHEGDTRLSGSSRSSRSVLRSDRPLVDLAKFN